MRVPCKRSFQSPAAAHHARPSEERGTQEEGAREREFLSLHVTGSARTGKKGEERGWGQCCSAQQRDSRTRGRTTTTSSNGSTIEALCTAADFSLKSSTVPATKSMTDAQMMEAKMHLLQDLWVSSSFVRWRLRRRAVTAPIDLCMSSSALLLSVWRPPAAGGLNAETASLKGIPGARSAELPPRSASVSVHATFSSSRRWSGRRPPPSA